MKIKFLLYQVIIIIMIAGIGAGGTLFWQNIQANPIIAEELSLDEQEATIRAIKKVTPAVVSIIVEDYQNMVMVINGKKVTQKQKKQVGSGTGFIISSDGYILTNRHVVRSGNTETAEYRIILNNGKGYFAQYIGVDPLKDLGILKIFDKNLPSVELGNSDDLVQGMSVVAIGNALGRYQNTVTKGIVSALGRSLEASDAKGNTEVLDNVIQTDAEINPGNSGGPLIDLNGRVMGINTAIDSEATNIGFAIPINDAKVIIKSIREEDRIVRPRIGVRYVMLTPELAAKNNLQRNSGAWVVNGENGEVGVLPNAPASKGGLQAGDIIFEINAIKVEGNNTLFNIIQKYKPGNRIGLKIQRGNRVIIKIVTLDEFK